MCVHLSVLVRVCGNLHRERGHVQTYMYVRTCRGLCLHQHLQGVKVSVHMTLTVHFKDGGNKKSITKRPDPNRIIKWKTTVTLHLRTNTLSFSFGVNTDFPTIPLRI